MNPSSVAHQYLNSISGTTTRIEFLIGYSDGTVAPTAVASAMVAPTGRTSDKFLAGVSEFKRGIGGIDDKVTVSVGLLISGPITTVWKV